MVIVLDAQVAVTPAGSPVAVPIPVAPVVVCVIAVNAVLIHKVGVAEGVDAVLAGVTVIVAVFPVNGVITEPTVTFVNVYTVVEVSGDGVFQIKVPEAGSVTL